MRQPQQPVILAPTRPNAGTQVWYRRQLDAAIAELHASLAWWLRAAYRKDPPALAHDDAAASLQRAVRRLTRRWKVKFDRLARRLGPEFTRRAGRHADEAWRARMRDAGFTVRMTMSPAVNDVLQATVHENVGLIRSIAEQHLTQVEGLVMRSVQQGRSIGELSQALQAQFGVTRRRAALIARDQNNKATAAITRVRQQQAGVTRAIWRHSTAGKVPRPSHVAMNGRPYAVAKGMWDKDEGKWVFPGELINCRCMSQPIIEGFSA
jgi:SPP1 gp7 family putative phage head morphogenesis protein